MAAYAAFPSRLKLAAADVEVVAVAVEVEDACSVTDLGGAALTVPLTAFEFSSDVVVVVGTVVGAVDWDWDTSLLAFFLALFFFLLLAMMRYDARSPFSAVCLYNSVSAVCCLDTAVNGYSIFYACRHCRPSKKTLFRLRFFCYYFVGASFYYRKLTKDRDTS